jgi:hypothetical protein
LPKLASEQAGTGEETKGAALASQQEVFMVFVKGILVLLSTKDTKRHGEKILRKIGRDRLPRLHGCCGSVVMG